MILKSRSQGTRSWETSLCGGGLCAVSHQTVCDAHRDSNELLQNLDLAPVRGPSEGKDPRVALESAGHQSASRRRRVEKR